MVELSFPPPTACEFCHAERQLFASPGGWLCWNCLPEVDRRGPDGQVIDEPSQDPRDVVDMRLIRLGLGREGQCCNRCGERRAPEELFRDGEAWICGHCQKRTKRDISQWGIERTGLPGGSKGQNASESTIVTHPPSDPRSDQSGAAGAIQVEVAV